MSFEGLNTEVMEKAKACESIEELRALCAEQGTELSDEQLDSVVGGVGNLCELHYKGCPFLVVCPTNGPSCPVILQ